MQVLKVIPLAVFGAVGVMLNIPQDQAVSNLSTWWVEFGLPPFDGILMPAVDSWVLAGCIAGSVALFVPWRRLMGYKSPVPKEVPTLDILADLDLLLRLESGEEDWHETENRVHQRAIVDEFRRIGLFPPHGGLPDQEEIKEIRARVVRYGVRTTTRELKIERGE